MFNDQCSMTKSQSLASNYFTFLKSISLPLPLGEGFGGEAFFYFKNSTVRWGEYSSHNDAITQPGAKMSL